MSTGIAHKILAKGNKAGVEATLPKILQECARDGVTDPARIAVMVANAMRESQLIPDRVEGTNYRTRRALLNAYSQGRLAPQGPDHWLNNPVGLPNHVYANMLGNGNEASGDGYDFRGRGLVQTTGRGNYKNLNDLSPRPMQNGRPIDFTQNPELAAREDLSVQILVQGMNQGVFTRSGSLSKYLENKPMTADTFTKTRRAFVGNMDANTVGAMTETIYNQIKDIDFHAPNESQGQHP